MTEDLKAKARDMIGEFKERKIPWIALAPVLCDLEQKNEKLDDLPMKELRLKEIIKAYRFLQVQRPKFLENPDFRIQKEVIGYLPYIYSKMPDGPDKEAEFQKLIDKVLNHEIGDIKIREISKSFSGTRKRGSFPKRTKKLPETQNDPVTALSCMVDSMSWVIGQVLKTKTREELREVVGEKCRELSIQLNCIANGEFLKLWNERRELKL